MKRIILVGAAGLLVAAAVVRPQETVEDQGTPGVSHAGCIAFDGRARDARALRMGRNNRYERGRLTDHIATRLAPAGNRSASPAPRMSSTDGGHKNLIDRYLFAGMAEAGVRPAPPATDLEFLRRVSLDLTGRIPTFARVERYVRDVDPYKRAKLVDELLGSPEWTDKWTMYFGDLFKNTARSDQVQRYEEGRNAFYKWIRASLAANKPYNQIARELISSAGSNSWQTGEINWVVGGFVTGGPPQDIYDQQLANTFETFLGIGHMNCVLCHNGAGHLTGLSLWGQEQKRSDAWALASHFSRTGMARVRVSDQPLQYYWTVEDNPPRLRSDYGLNTTTGNRPARCASGFTPPPGEPCAATSTIAPRYRDGEAPKAGETYRTALAGKVTADPQFARATVNYIWAELFGRGLVEPVNQFDLARLDPDNPPPAPWKLQPSNAALLRDLALAFASTDGYDLKQLMKTMVLSESYQLSSRYEGIWNTSWEPLYARKLVRRLWGEELHDSIALASNIVPTYNVRNLGTVRWAMQLPETNLMPDGGGRVAQFLDSFLRGNREDQVRGGDGSLLQALNLMNDPFVLARTRSSQTAGINGNDASLAASVLRMADDALVRRVFLTVLSREPSAAENATALDALKQGPRQQAVENLIWTLYNKVDFLFNY